MLWRGSMRMLCKTGSVFVTLSFLDVGLVHAASLIDPDGRRRSGEAIALDSGFHLDDHVGERAVIPVDDLGIGQGRGMHPRARW